LNHGVMESFSKPGRTGNPDGGVCMILRPGSGVSPRIEDESPQGRYIIPLGIYRYVSVKAGRMVMD
jgi:hypothetical protein